MSEQLELNGRVLDWPSLLEEALTAPGSLGNTYSRFHDYSFGNMILLMIQGVNEPVAGYKRWVELGRQVKQGARAKAILHPVVVKVTDAETGAERKAVRGFKLRNSVFPYSDTEGEELPPYEPKEWSEERALGELAIQRVPFDAIDGNMAGWSFERSVAVNPMAPYPFKTLLHELGHVVLGHTNREEIHEYKQHRGVKEFQAESTAYLCVNELQATDAMDMAESRHYVQTWLRGEQPDDKACKQVFAATTQILRAGRIAIDVNEAA